MLVLSRRSQQQIAFPELGITLSVLQVRGRIVKIGIDAPTDVKVQRQEAADQIDHPIMQQSECHETTSDVEEHRRRNQLNLLQLHVDAIRLRLQRGDHVDAKKLIVSLFDKLDIDGYEISSPDIAQGKSLEKKDRQIRILVVDDSENERGLMTYLLASNGFVVYVARDGAEALQQLRCGCGLPDVVLMDLNMPLANGMEALQYFRHDEHLRHLLIYAVTGARRNPADEPVGRGWDRWFSKPVDVRQLVEAIREDCSIGSHVKTTSRPMSAANEVQP
jgi:carbon storage regulator CsrA